MKKQIPLLILTMLFSGCSAKELSWNDVDGVIVDKNAFKLVDLDSDQPVIFDELARANEDIGLAYYGDKIYADDDFWYASTSADGKIGQWIEKINKKTLAVERVRSNAGQINALAFDGKYIIASNNAINEIKFDIYDRDLNLVETKTVDYKPDQLRMIQEVELVPAKDGYWLLMYCNPKNMPDSYLENHLLYLDKDFKVQRDINLELYNAANASLCIVKNKAYIAEAFNISDNDGQVSQSNWINIYDLDSGSLEDSVELDVTSYGNLLFDENRNLIILDRSGNKYYRNIPFVIINPDTYETAEWSLSIEDQKALFGDEVSNVSDNTTITFVQLLDNTLYLLYTEFSKLIAWDLDNLHSQIYSLEDISERPYSILIPN